MLEGASELRIMLCKEKRTAGTARVGTSVVAACGARWHPNGATCSTPHASQDQRLCTFFHGHMPRGHLPESCETKLLSVTRVRCAPTIGSMLSDYDIVYAAGIFVDDILDAVPIDKYFELFKPGTGGEGGFIRVAMNFDSNLPENGQGACRS